MTREEAKQITLPILCEMDYRSRMRVYAPVYRCSTFQQEVGEELRQSERYRREMQRRERELRPREIEFVQDMYGYACHVVIR